MRFLIFYSLLSFTYSGHSQNSENRSFFRLNGDVSGKDTGKIVLLYNDMSNRGVSDTAIIKNGKFEFSGTVNKICDAYLWTDLKNKNFSDKSVIRFLLQTGIISVSYTNGLSENATIKGSKTQYDWENWEKKKSTFIMSKADYKMRADSIYLLAKTDSTQLIILRELVNKLDSVNIVNRQADLAYVTQNTHSYLSGFLLSRYKRQMAVDSIEKFFDLLSQDVKSSNVGYTVLSYAYPLSNNLNFKKANPLNGIQFNEKLASIKTVYDLTSSDSSGDIIDFNRFRGNYLYIDFWASWCVPCIKDIPALKNTIEKYKGVPIKFISVSLDTDEKKWKKAILDNNMYWLQASELTGFQGLVPTYCKIIIGVPQYVLVDKNGVIVSPDAPRPGTPELTSLLNSVL